MIVLAEGALTKLEKVAGDSGYATEQKSLTATIGQFINIGLGLLGTIFVVLIIKAGYDWMLAQGDAAKITKSKDTIFRAIIGLLIILGAYAIQAFVFNKL